APFVRRAEPDMGLGAAIERCVLIGKGGLYGNVIRTGMMLNSTKEHVDELIAALDAGFATV
ncbi:MAG: hypothetical protein ABR554_16520, partial [Pyrinomonadaceae bacterium]